MDPTSSSYVINAYDPSNVTDRSTVWSLKANQGFIEALSSGQAEVEFLSAKEAIIHIGSHRFHLNLSAVEHTEWFVESSAGTLDFNGLIDGRFVIVDSNKEISHPSMAAPPPKKHIAATIDVPPSAHLQLSSPLKSSHNASIEKGKADLSKSFSRPNTTKKPTIGTNMVSIAALPISVTNADILRFFSGLKIKSIYFALQGGDGVAYVLFESHGGAELALMRSGETLIYQTSRARMTATVTAADHLTIVLAQTIGIDVARLEAVSFEAILNFLQANGPMLLASFPPNHAAFLASWLQLAYESMVFDIKYTVKMWADALVAAHDLDVVKDLSPPVSKDALAAYTIPNLATIFSSLPHALSSLRELLRCSYGAQSELLLSSKIAGGGGTGRPVTSATPSAGASKSLDAKLFKETRQLLLRYIHLQESMYCLLLKLKMQRCMVEMT
eukprot:gene34012-41159_t